MLERVKRQWRRLKERGVVDRARWALVSAESRAWEGYFGVSTDRRRTRADDGLGAESSPYEPLPWPLLRRGMRALEPGPDDVLLDYGSGLGRVLLMAARHPLKRVVGVELIPRLATRARANLAAAQHRLQSPVELFTADATTWEVPDDVTLIVAFNPFTGSVMAGAQQRIVASLSRRPRALKVLYAWPDDQPNLFRDCNWLRPQRRLATGVYDEMNLVVYEHRSWGPTPTARRAEAEAVT